MVLLLGLGGFALAVLGGWVVLLLGALGSGGGCVVAFGWFCFWGRCVRWGACGSVFVFLCLEAKPLEIHFVIAARLVSSTFRFIQHVSLQLAENAWKKKKKTCSTSGT